MNAEEAIACHRAWKDSRQAALTSPWNLDIEQISGDHACRLGNWLHGDGLLEYGHLPEYRRCLDIHRQFHAEATRLAGAINDGRLFYAQRLMASGSAYSTASESLGIALIALFNAAKYFATATPARTSALSALSY